MKSMCALSVFCVSLVSTTFGADSASVARLLSNTEFSGYTFIEAGEVRQGEGAIVPYKNRWLEDACFGLFATTRIDKNLKVLMGFEGELGFPFNIVTNAGENYIPYRQIMNSFWVSRGEGLYTYGNTAGTSLQFEAGYFPYKYNPEVRNLGEYLFRTYCYPTTMVNQVDRTFTELLGFRVGNTINGVFHHDLIFYSETKLYPYNDFSLAYLADFAIPKFLTIGGGVNLYRLIPVNGSLTTPENAADPANLYESDTTGMYIDPSTQQPVYIVNQKWIGYGGTKVMGRATLDFKGFIPEDFSNLLGPEDLKAYGEIAVLGWKNYPSYYYNGQLIDYSDRWQRTPITMGFYFPTLKMLDVFDMELEYLDAPYDNSILQPFYNLVPIPNPPSPHDKWKWSLYAKKTIGTRMSITVQVARDHMIPKSINANPGFQDYTDVTGMPGDWWFNIRTRFDF